MELPVNCSMKINSLYEIHEMVGKGNFGNVYRVTDPIGVNRAAKFVSESSFCFLENETAVMPFLGRSRQPGMPCWYYFGRHGEHFVLVMDLFSHSLRSVRNKYDVLSLKTSLLLGIQMTTSIESVHNQGFVHCDITPDNFVLGKDGEDRKCLYLIDYGISERHTQSPLPCCLESRRSDLQSVILLLIYLCNNLPWEHVCFAYTTGLNPMRARTQTTELWADIPVCIRNYYMDVMNLGDDQRPDYDMLRGHLQVGLNVSGLEVDYKFEWMRQR